MFTRNLSRQKKFAKGLLILLLIFFVISLIQIYFLKKASFEKILLLTCNIMMIILFLTFYFIVKMNISFIEKRLKEIEKIELSSEFEIKSLRKNIRLFSYIIVLIMLIYVLSVHINILLKELTSKYIFYTVFLFGNLVFICYKVFKELKNRKYSLNISGKTIKILYENNEIEFIKTDNIDYVKFYAISLGKRGKEKNPTLQIYDSEKKMIVEMSIEVMDYYLLKKFFTKYNVTIDDHYNEF